MTSAAIPNPLRDCFTLSAWCRPPMSLDEFFDWMIWAFDNGLSAVEQQDQVRNWNRSTEKC